MNETQWRFLAEYMDCDLPVTNSQSFAASYSKRDESHINAINLLLFRQVCVRVYVVKIGMPLSRMRKLSEFQKGGGRERAQGENKNERKFMCVKWFGIELGKFSKFLNYHSTIGVDVVQHTSEHTHTCIGKLGSLQNN